ncbi:MAG: alpha-galactosidase [Oligosphaeraceae bacterium]
MAMTPLIQEKNLVFRLDSGNASYAFQVTPDGRLRHLYWGPALAALEELTRLNGKNPYPAEPSLAPEDNQAWREHQLWEFAPEDIGIYAPATAAVRSAQGTQVTDPRYVSHRVLPGKPALPGLPASYGEEQECQTLEVVMEDPATRVQFCLRYTAFRDLPVLARSMAVANRGDAPVELRRAASLTTDFWHESLDVCYFDGFWGKERCFHREALQGGMKVLESTRGLSGHAMNPSVILCEREATEETGRAYGALLVYSGSFAIEVEQSPLYRTRLNLGLHPQRFQWLLQPGESFQTPEALQGFSPQGLGCLSRAFHDFLRNHLIPRQWRDAPRPILINNWEAMHFDFSKEKLVKLARTAKANGVELLVLDDGWFGKRNSDRNALGDWTPNQEKLGGTIGELADAIRAEGLKFGLWFEPEMISRDSDLFRQHPDWAIQAPGHSLSYHRFQYMLDFSRPEVVDHVYETISRVIQEAKLDYMKWDANREMTEVGSAGLPPERQGEVSHRYVLGLYDLYQRLTRRFPKMLIEGCSAGGGRFDAGILAFSPQFWTSDNSDAFSRLFIQYGTSFFYPCSAMGAHVAVNWFPQRYSPVETRAAVAFAGTFGYELDLDRMPPEELAQVKAQCQFYHQCHHLVQNGDYYRLTSPYRDNTVAWMHLAKDKSQCLLTVVFVRYDAAYAGENLRLPGLDPQATYSDGTHTWPGNLLIQAGYPITTPKNGDMISLQILLQKE